MTTVRTDVDDDDDGHTDDDDGEDNEDNEEAAMTLAMVLVMPMSKVPARRKLTTATSSTVTRMTAAM
eukprot:9303355-Pyramimonas_sp.AAC.1